MSFLFGGEGGTRIKFLLRKILLICSALAHSALLHKFPKFLSLRLLSQISPAKNDSPNRFINAFVFFKGSGQNP